MKKKILYTLGGLVALFVVIGILAPDPEKSAVQNLEQKAQNLNTDTDLLESGNLNITEQTSLPTSQIQRGYEVVKVVDGDTLDVSIDGKTERLRLIGIDTPETVDPRKPVQCFGIEASNKAKNTLTGKKVFLEADSTQGERDKYDRLLRYIFLEDGANFNLMMIKEGYAHEYTYGTPYKYQSVFKQAQKDAEAGKKGLWATGVCEKLAPAPATTAPKSTQTSSGCNSNYSGCLKPNAGDYDCAGGTGDGPNYTGAVQVIGYDEYKLDRDGDGWACEK
jgi:endonuclease YncB( thermonuclease family)